jgi:hypothetical protein
MKTTVLKIFAAITLGLFVASTTVYAQGQWGAGAGAQKTIEAKAISKPEAEKKYPPPSGGSYPMGERDPHDPSGTVNSPYPPHQKYDCAKIAHGGLVLDTRANKVFVRP